MKLSWLTTVTATWTAIFAAGFITGLQGSTNLVTWYDLTNMVVVGTNMNVQVTLSNRPPQKEYYRAYVH
jgi:hypothetical protein